MVLHGGENSAYIYSLWRPHGKNCHVTYSGSNCTWRYFVDDLSSPLAVTRRHSSTPDGTRHQLLTDRHAAYGRSSSLPAPLTLSNLCLIDMDDQAQEGPSPRPSLIATLLTAAALIPQASAVLSARPGTAEAVNAAARAALDAVRQAVQGSPPPPALPAPPASGAPGVAALGAPREAPEVAAPGAPRRAPGIAAPGAPRGERPRRASLTIQQKQLLITQVDDKVPRDVLAQRYGISKRTIHSVSARRREVWAAAAAGAPSFARCVQPCRFPLVNSLLFEWFLRIRTMGRKTMPLSRLALSVKARELAQRHYPGQDFSASNGFIDRWARRHGVRSIHLHGSGGGVDIVEGETSMAELRAKMVGLDPDCILNMDEAALSYQLAPTRSYVMDCDARETRGTAMQPAKACTTLIICINATGTFKSISVIGKAAEPVCFRGVQQLPLRYYSQKNAWMDSTVYAKWLADLSADWAAFTAQRGFLVIDNASGHDSSKTSDRLDIEWLPSNTTALFQPADQGAINAVKSIYRRGMMREMLGTFDQQFEETPPERDARRRRDARARPGSLGVADGRAPHVLDAMRLVKEAFSGLSATAIMRCWLRAKCTPPDVSRLIQLRLDQAVAAAREPPPTNDAQAIVALLRSARSLGPVGGQHVGEGANRAHEGFIPGSHPRALSVIEVWLGDEDSADSIMSVVDTEINRPLARRTITPWPHPHLPDAFCLILPARRKKA